MLTSLPIAFAEGFSLDSVAHPAMVELEKQYAVRLVDGPEQLAARGLLLAIQPRAFPAERLVALDTWVRDGGRIVLLADPSLGWESERPLGDVLRPPAAFPDTGLLKHWGLTLYAPEKAGPQTGTLSGHEVITGSPGTLASSIGNCRIEDSGLVARCRIGDGWAVVIADADFLNLRGSGALDGPTSENLSALLAVLSSLPAK
ncbi:hypothetical protein ACFQPG_04325 [Sphingomonas sp. GCM10030256]|uniref:hypothetical protein n=1 Tax=Sphingomonas sp. GCM10030256 TaxID=3273427 RepID=UPI00361F86D9